MIIIFSETDDQATSEVIEWLEEFNSEYLLIENFLFEEINLIFNNLDKSYFVINNKKIFFKKIKSIWYRRTHYANFFEVSTFLKKSEIFDEILEQLKNENRILCENIFNIFKELGVKIIGNPFNESLNKLDVNQLAIKNGLHIPESWVLNKKSSVLSLLNKGIPLITKGMYEVFCEYKNERYYYTHTEKIDNKNLISLEETFTPSFFQRQIDKIYEIRSLYFDGNLYSMSILSQENENTLIDLRNYDYCNLNYEIPLELDFEIISKISNLMNDIQLNIGVIDFILSEDNKIYFLEVNPVGQFMDIQFAGNYEITKKIANFLVNK